MNEVAWAGGFYCGEGCVYISHRHPPYKSIGITITQAVDDPNVPVVPEVFTRFNAAVGGICNITGPYFKPKRKPFFILTVYSFERVGTIELLWPWLSKVKQNQATRVITEMQEYFDART